MRIFSKASSFICLLLLITGGSPVLPRDRSQYDVRYFSETGHQVRGRFLEYWERNGSLKQQGYPISEEMQERSEVDGKTYLIQYFERAVFELHPENRPPNDVLLSLLGAFRYRAKYPNGASIQRPNMSQGSVFFSQTGRRLGGSFLLYWNTYGGLAQQGYPISDEIQERSDLDGKTYTVQYFERSVMEWHPGNTPPNDVLLSHLGTFRYNAKYMSGVVQPSATGTANQSQLIATSVMGNPITGGRYLFWTDNRNPKMAIYGYDLEASQEFLVKELPLGAAGLASDGQTLVWVEGTPRSGDSLHSYNLTTRQESIIISPNGGEFGGLALDNGTLYYQGSSGLVGRNLSTGQEQLISAKGQNPVAADGKLLWTELDQHCPAEGWCPYEYVLYFTRQDVPTNKILLTKSGGENNFSSYGVSGDKAVWSYIDGASRFVVYDVNTGTSKSIQGSGIFNTTVGGTMVAWTEGPIGTPNAPSRWSVKVYDITSDSSWTIIQESSSVNKACCIIDGRSLAYVADGMLYVSPLR